jgi:NADPH:quinone reductase-like Zn-dependent oxidoreductase
MKALVLDRYGSVDGFRVADVPKPKPKPGEVCIRVRATSINSWDWELARGDLLARLAAPFGSGGKILGGDVAGTVDALGDGVSGLVLGDAVYGDFTSCGWGGFSEYAIAKANAVRLIPADLDFAAAATLPQAGVLALQAVRKSALGLGTDVLVIGGGGGVGTFAIQMAKAAGARVTAIDDFKKSETMACAGADVVLDRAKADPDRHPARYDLVIDPVARRSFLAQMRLLKPGGVYAIVGGRIGTILQSWILGALIAPRFGKRVELVVWHSNGSELDELASLAGRGVIKPIIEQAYPLDEGVSAMRHFAEGRALGKLIIVPNAA